MKSSVARTLALIAALTLFAALLTACGASSLSKPNNGAYRSEDGLQTWTFSGSNSITLTAGGIFSLNGTYDVSDDKLTVTTTGMFGSVSGYTITEITAKSFFIDGVKFIKQ
ncbi:MAG: hypothetical protein LBL15_01190 [Oscillospiraceae bacterium]|jgi:major membrane immunogen (membrane-anchored lipoprotein)|nr:hypothetical protein [Oscillospiraceae bacterium]